MKKGPNQIKKSLLPIDEELRVEMPLKTIQLYKVFKWLASHFLTYDHKKSTLKHDTACSYVTGGFADDRFRFVFEVGSLTPVKGHGASRLGIKNNAYLEK